MSQCQRHSTVHVLDHSIPVEAMMQWLDDIFVCPICPLIILLEQKRTTSVFNTLGTNKSGLSRRCNPSSENGELAVR